MKTKSIQKSAPAASKIDLIKIHKADYVAPKKPVLLDIKPARYLIVDGEGKPGGDVFQARIGALYAMAYTVKMTRKFGGQQDYTIGKLEGRYLDLDQKPMPEMNAWRWQLMIRTPDIVAKAELEKAVTALRKRGKEGDAALVRLEDMHEGLCVQMLHVGPYDQEGKTVEVMCDFAKSQGMRFSGPHHEIYISDPRRVEPARLKTILRLPVSHGT
jgi:hypothetical protein